jgi:hypothetical protein
MNLSGPCGWRVEMLGVVSCFIMRELKLIFVHIPKSGGTSIRAAVTEFFSHDLVLDDYGDRPNDPISPMNIDPYGFLDRCRKQNALTLANKAAVIGHFWIAKYEGVACATEDAEATWGAVIRDRRGLCPLEWCRSCG